MEITSLKNLKKDGPVFELYTEVIVNNKPFAVFKFPCTERHNMRIDLIAFDIYNNTDNIDVLCAVNGLYQPLSVQDGDVIYFVDDKQLDAVRSDAAVIEAVVDAVKGANKGKQKKNDSNRSNDVAQRANGETAKKFTPPNLVQTQNTNIDYGEGVIILKPNF